ncbi:MAG TPA: hypothetical protein VJX16_13800 [Terriglobales bacterium]|nr:hypothetical protein [Terriglobales bacterium]
MTGKKKREKVTAEITAAYLSQFAGELGAVMTREEAIAFLNRDGRAYGMWKQMMQAGEEYIKNTLQQQTPVRLRQNDPKRPRIAI